jgi:hypothetical protein
LQPPGQPHAFARREESHQPWLGKRSRSLANRRRFSGEKGAGERVPGKSQAAADRNNRLQGEQPIACSGRNSAEWSALYWRAASCFIHMPACLRGVTWRHGAGVTSRHVAPAVPHTDAAALLACIVCHTHTDARLARCPAQRSFSCCSPACSTARGIPSQRR